MELRDEFLHEQKAKLISGAHMCAASRVLSAVSASSYVNDYISGKKSISCLSENPEAKIKFILERLADPAQVSFGGLAPQVQQLKEIFKEVFPAASPKKENVKKHLEIRLE